MEIKNIGVHHFAGTLTLEQVNEIHRAEWPELPSKLRPDLWVGYNFIIWKDGTYTQTRYIGEQTAAQKGHNEDTVSIALCGDFTRGKDQPTIEQQKTLKFIVNSIVEQNNVYQFHVWQGTVINVGRANIYPHRVLQPNHTECYGSSLTDTWARDLCYPPQEVVAASEPFPTIPVLPPLPSEGPERAAWIKLAEALVEYMRSIIELRQPKLGGFRNRDACVWDVIG